MPITKQQKKEILAKLEKKLEGFKSLVFSDFTGLSVEKLRKLKSELKKSGIYYQVTKKNLLNIALEKLGFKTKSDGGLLDKNFKGSVAIAVSYNDEITAPKILYKFSKENEMLRFIGGIIDKKIIAAKELIELAKLPSKEKLIAKLAFILKFPLTKLAMTIREVSKKVVSIKTEGI